MNEPYSSPASVPPPGKGEGGKPSRAKSQVISARLHPAFPTEKSALDIFNSLLAAKYTPRAIITDALNRAAGLTPEMFADQERVNSLAYKLEQQLEDIGDLSNKIDDGIGSINTRIETMREELLTALTDRIGDILRSIKTSDPVAFKEFAVSDDEGLEFSAEFIANAKKAFKGSYRK